MDCQYPSRSAAAREVKKNGISFLNYEPHLVLQDVPLDWLYLWVSRSSLPLSVTVDTASTAWIEENGSKTENDMYTVGHEQC